MRVTKALTVRLNHHTIHQNCGVLRQPCGTKNSMNISAWIEYWAGCTPEKVAIRFEGRSITYADLYADIRQTAHLLQHDLAIARGDRVAHLGFDHPGFFSLMFACARIGAILVPLNTRLAAPEHIHVLQDSGAKVLFIDAAFANGVEAIIAEIDDLQLIGTEPLDTSVPHRAWSDGTDGIDVDASDPKVTLDDPLLLVYTSGTTGRPKGAVITQSHVHWNALNATNAFDIRRDDHVLSSMPLFHVGGINVQCTPAFRLGATVTLLRKFDVEGFYAELKAGRPTLTIVVPAFLRPLMQHPQWESADWSCFRCMCSGSTIVPMELFEAFHSVGLVVVQIYGCTEAGPVVTHTTIENSVAQAGTNGHPAMYGQARIVGTDGNDVATGQRGELLVKGPHVIREYWRNEEATRTALPGGWFHTGDVFEQNEDGYYRIVDRIKDVIISGSENIYPAELEFILNEHPEIIEAAVVGRPDERWGEVAAAVIVKSPGSALDQDSVLRLFDGRLGRFKHPKTIAFVEALPRNALGKIVKRDVRDTLVATLEDKNG